MQQRRGANLLLFLLAGWLLHACASAPPPALAHGSLEVLLDGEMQRISDVEGPYSGVHFGRHTVAVRSWANGLDDGVAELSVFVTNGTWSALELAQANIRLAINGQILPLLSANEMVDLIISNVPPPETENESMTEGQLSNRSPSSEMRGSGQGGNEERVAAGLGLPSAVNRTPRETATVLPDRELLASDVRRWMLQSTEIAPGETGSGGIAFVVPAEVESIQVSINLGGEAYEFDLAVRR